MGRDLRHARERTDDEVAFARTSRSGSGLMSMSRFGRSTSSRIRSISVVPPAM